MVLLPSKHHQLTPKKKAITTTLLLHYIDLPHDKNKKNSALFKASARWKALLKLLRHGDLLGQNTSDGFVGRDDLLSQKLFEANETLLLVLLRQL